MKKGLIFLVLFALSTNMGIAAQLPWHLWVQELKQEALADGIGSSFFDRTFRNIRPNKRIIHFDNRQPIKRLTFMKYRTTRGSAYRIKLGKLKYKRHYRLLRNIGAQFGVDPCFITAIWGMESSYGHYMGNFPVIPSLATLAYDQRRSEFFRKELLLALHMLQGGHVPPGKFKGEWAGGSGHPQFLPSSWHKYAVDYNNDGRKDIWTNYGDVFASIANYLAQNGWQTKEPWAIPVKLPHHFNSHLIGYEHAKTVAEWRHLGVRILENHHFPSRHLTAWIIKPHGGPALMIFQNFKTIMTYNNSAFYAGTIGYMADKICSRSVYSVAH